MERYVIVQRTDERSKEIETHLHRLLKTAGFLEDKVNPELVITIGGDGTFLYALHQYIEQCDKLCFVGIHTGTLGFLTAYAAKDIEKFISDLTYKKPIIDTKSLLEFQIDDKDTYYALNEVRIENVMKTQIMDVYINNKYFETFRGTGICLSSQIGSTAYNRSLKGAVIDSDLELLQMTEITGIHHRLFQSLQSPIILAKEKTVCLRSDCFEGAMLCYDYLNMKLEGTHQITCRLADKKINILRFKKYNFIKRLRNLF